MCHGRVPAYIIKTMSSGTELLREDSILLMINVSSYHNVLIRPSMKKVNTTYDNAHSLVQLYEEPVFKIILQQRAEKKYH